MTDTDKDRPDLSQATVGQLTGINEKLTSIMGAIVCLLIVGVVMLIIMIIKVWG